MATKHVNMAWGNRSIYSGCPVAMPSVDTGCQPVAMRLPSLARREVLARKKFTMAAAAIVASLMTGIELMKAASPGFLPPPLKGAPRMMRWPSVRGAGNVARWVEGVTQNTTPI